MTNQELVNKIIAEASEAVKAWEAPGVAISIVKDGEVLYAGGVGVRDDKGTPTDGKTLVQIASCTKAFTAACVCLLATEGKLDMDTPIVEYMPDFRMNDTYATANLTIRDFLSHRSGLPRHEYAWYGTGYSRDQLVKNVKDLPLSAPIRYRFQYSNFNYLIAGALVERVSGMKFEDFLLEKLLKPIGMTQSHVYLDEIESDENHALAFDHEGEYGMHGLRVIPYYESPAQDKEKNIGDPTAAAGCIVSNAEDMTKWLQFQLNKGKVGDKQLIREDLMDLMTSTHIYTGEGGAYAPARSMTSYGLGWSIYNHRGHKMFEHGGNLNGQSSSVAVIPDLNLGIFTSVNLNANLLADAVVMEATDAFMGANDTDWYDKLYKATEAMYENVKAFFASYGGTPVEGTTPTHKLEDYAGTYEAPGYRRFLITYENGELKADFNHWVVGLKHYHYDTFQTVGTIGEIPSGFIITFANDSTGTIKTLSATFGSEKGLKPIVFTKA